MTALNGISIGVDGIPRCGWSNSARDYQLYHDEEWGFPYDDDARLFEQLCLEGFQSGLSWLTILRRREGFRVAFRDFDFRLVARMTDTDVERLLSNQGIVRHRGKIEATINNAGRALELEEECGSLGKFFWSFEPWPSRNVSVVSSTVESTAMTKELKDRGFRFVGPVTVYAFMQAVGIVNGHLPGCITGDEVEAVRVAFVNPRDN